MATTFVVLDVDGTLFGRTSRLDGATSSILHRISASGALIALATGRPVSDALGWAQHTGAAYIIPLNGSAIVRVSDRVPIWVSHGLAAPVVAEISRLTAHRRMRTNLHTLTTLHASHDDYATRDYARRHCVTPTFKHWTEGDPAVLLAEVSGTPTALAELRAVLPPVVSVVATRDSIGTPYLDITPPGIDKGSALRRLICKLGIDGSDVLALGNGENDVSMFAAAGRSVAVNGSPAALLQRATHLVTLSADQGAVRTALCALLDGDPASLRHLHPLTPATDAL
jgi:Cof subfamily protein (haloacid dehalogenase superfamily)